MTARRSYGTGSLIVRIDGNGVDVGARESVGGGEGESIARAVTARGRKVLGDCAFEDVRGFERVARFREAIEETPRRIASP